MRGSRVALTLAVVLLGGSTGCASPSCPAVFLDPVVHVDASAWVGDHGLTTVTVKATICVASICRAATAVGRGNPDDLLAPLTLPTGTATVRVKLTASDGRALDQTTTAEIKLTKPFGSGCGGRDEIDLAVTKAGALVPGRPAKVG